MDSLCVWQIVLQLIEPQAMNIDARIVLVFSVCLFTVFFFFFAIVNRVNLDFLVMKQFSLHNLKGWDKDDVLVSCGCHNRVPQSGGLNKRNLFAHDFRG